MDNLINIKHLDKESIIEQLNIRYKKDIIYTKIDNILIAVNPFKNVSKIKNSPHPDFIADSMYRDLVNKKTNQSVLISGESGAGKTETTKILLKKLLNNNDTSIQNITSLILASNIILECFGNAATIRNHNSSRFGKLISLIYQDNKIIGAKIKTYLLEKIRVTDTDKSEKTFHCFYLLNNKEKNDSDLFDGKNTLEKLYKSFELFDLDKYIEDIKNILRIITLLKNYQQNIDELVSLLQVEKEKFIKSIEKQEIKIGTEVILKDLSENQINIKIKTLQQELYYNLFKFIVDKINIKLQPEKIQKKLTNKIYLLDIFGFEILNKNSIEQLCINYTNEILQNEFNKYFFEKEQQLYLSEGLPFNLVEFTNNDEIIECIENTIFKKINEVTKFIKPKDIKIIDDLFKEPSKYYSISNLDKGKGRFNINHYASRVTYNIKNFISKNNMNLPADISSLISICDNNLIKMFEIESSKKLLLQKFYKNIKQLQKVINSTQVNFIRCLKPNDKNIPDFLDNNKISTQLKYNGIVEAIAISRQGYPIRYMNDEFDKTFKIIPNINKNSLIRGLTMTFLKTEEENQLINLKQTILNKKATIISRKYKSYNQRCKYLNILERIILIQKNVRMMVSKIKYKRHKASKEIQSLIRMYLQKKIYGKNIKALIIQRNYRMSKSLKKYKLYIGKCKIIQNFVRQHVCKLDKNVETFKHTAANKIINFFKRIRTFNNFSILKKLLLIKIRLDKERVNMIREDNLSYCIRNQMKRKVKYNRNMMIQEDNNAKYLRDREKNLLINHLHKENKELLDAIAQKDLMMLQKLAQLEEKLVMLNKQKQEKNCVIM